MTEDERRERIEATASRMIAELLERAANGEALVGELEEVIISEVPSTGCGRPC